MYRVFKQNNENVNICWNKFMHHSSWLWGIFCGQLDTLCGYFCFSAASVGKAISSHFCMVPRLQIRWRSAWITCDFTRLWSGWPANTQIILIWWLPAESPINTSVDRSYLLPLKSKWAEGRLEYRTLDESSNQPTTPSYFAVVSEWGVGSSCYLTVVVSSGVPATEES